jgi:hypothetical protein
MKRAIAALALSAMLAVQLSGGIATYFCECTGKSLVTLDEHCHGQHGEHGPLDHAPSGHRHHDEDHSDTPADSESHHHELVKTPTDAIPPTVVVVPLISVPSVQWIEILETQLTPKEEPCLVIYPPPDNDGPPSLPLIVVGSVVFLI